MTIRYNTTVDDIITSQKQYKIVYSDRLEEVYDGVLVTTPHQVFLNWFDKIQHLITLKRWIVRLLQLLYWHLMKKILKILMMVLAS